MSGGGEEPLWLADGLPLHVADLTSATADGDGVMLHFGARAPIAEPPGAFAASPVAQILISAQTAQNLRHLLARLIADIEATSGV